jgi:hypothetical protein
MGAWGGWALAPDTASMGRDYRSHRYWSQQGSGTFKPPAIFLTLLAGGNESVIGKRVPLSNTL